MKDKNDHFQVNSLLGTNSGGKVQKWNCVPLFAVQSPRPSTFNWTFLFPTP